MIKLKIGHFHSFMVRMLIAHIVYISVSILCENSNVFVIVASSEEVEHEIVNKNPSRLAKARNYLYLNYKDMYGIRYDPKYTRKKLLPQMDITSGAGDASIEVNTVDVENNSIPTSSIAPISTELPPSTTPASDSEQFSTSTSIPTTTTTINRISSSTTAIPNSTNTSLSLSTTLTHKRPIIDFPSLLNRSSTLNTTNNMQPTSTLSLRDTLNMIRKRIRQWFVAGIDMNASLVNGQRFLNVFNVIKFDNVPCASTQEGLTEMNGICYHDYQCTQMGGNSIDTCADGLGVCCIFKAECGQKTNQLTTYFQNPNWPEASQDRIICTLTLELQPDVSQVLLEFILFELKAPTAGNCVEDQFFVAGQNLNNHVPTICGINSGQHMYIEVDNSMDGKLFLSILTTSPATRAYNIRVTQLRDSLAPSKCLQYYTDTEGWIQTFNYDDTSKFVTVRSPSYFNNLNYAICIQRQWEFCSVTYSNEVDDIEYDFQLINVDSEGTSVIPAKHAGVEIFSCNDDFISVNSIRLCGEKLNDASRVDDLTQNAVITDTTNGPNFLPVRTNDVFVGRGFRINYKQIPCEEESQASEPSDDTIDEMIFDEEINPSQL